MNPLNTFEKAKDWADTMSKKFSNSVNGIIPYVVCSYNDGYIVHNIKHVYEHRNEYVSKEILYCTDSHEFKIILLTLRMLK